MIEKKEVNLSAVVTAANFNPSIVTKDWLAAKGIVTEAPAVFSNTPVFSLNEYSAFRLVVDESRLQALAKGLDEKSARLLEEVVMQVVEKLPETPYSAVGLNHAWQLTFKEASTKDCLATIFGVKDPGVVVESGGVEGYWGITRYYRHGFFTVTVQIDPAISRDDFTLEAMQVSLNFHRELGQSANKLDLIREAVSEIRNTREYAVKVVDRLAERYA